MAGISNRSSTPNAKQAAAAERIAKLTDEQRRLKAAAAERREASAATAEEAGEGFVVKAQSPPATARRSQYLQ